MGANVEVVTDTFHEKLEAKDGCAHAIPELASGG